MHLSWHRWGILTGLIPILVFVLTQLLTDLALGRGYYVAHTWPKFAGFQLSALTIGIVGYALNRNIATLASKHRFFWVPVEYWSIPLSIFGFYALSQF